MIVCMKLTGGTKEALELIEALKSTGNLIDVYSREWMASKEDGRFGVDELDALMEEHGDEFIHHLLVVMLDEYNQEISEKLIAVYPPLAAVLKDNYHHADFLFINLATRQILAIGLARKNRMYMADVASGLDINTHDFFNNEYIKKFTELDHCKVVWEISDALERLGQSYYDFDHLPGNPDIIFELLSNPPEEDGLYHYDGETYSRQELEDIDREMAEILDYEEEWVETLQEYFPNLPRSDLTTQDY